MSELPAFAPRYTPPGNDTARSRIAKVMAGQVPDRMPASFWVHNCTREQTIEDLVSETLRLQETFRFDFVKPQSPAHAACMVWGAEVTQPTRPDVWPVLTRPVLRSTSDLGAIRPMPVSSQLADQVEVMRRIRAAVGKDVPVVGTVFAPLMVMWLMHEGRKEATLDMVREAPDQLTPALDAIADTLCEFARMLIEDVGVDGIFYATTTCCRGEMSEEAHARYHAPYDKQILAASRGAWMNVIHLCGHEIEAHRFVDCDVPIVSWELCKTNPGLTEMRSRFQRTMLTGVPAKPAFGSVPVEVLRQDTRAAVAEAGGRNLIVAPGCSINPGVDESRIGVVMDEVRSIVVG